MSAQKYERFIWQSDMHSRYKYKNASPLEGDRGVRSWRLLMSLWSFVKIAEVSSSCEEQENACSPNKFIAIAYGYPLLEGCISTSPVLSIPFKSLSLACSVSFN